MNCRKYWIYILTSNSKNAIYIGVTNDLERRVWEHRNDMGSGFAKKYRVTRLVHVEEYDKPADAIAREKQLKGCAANGRTNWSVLPTPNGAICCRQERRKRSRSA